jgi:4-carboxymuconolactone decarboxylase
MPARDPAPSRVPPVDPAALDAEQRKVHDLIVSTRQGGEIRGPFAIWIRNAGLAAAANEMGNALRLKGRLDAKLFELIILVVARHWSAQYEWFAHAKDAARVGLDAGVVEAIRTHRVPSFTTPQECAVYELTRELIETRDVSDASYQRALATFGFDLLAEIVTVAGFYTLVAMMLNAFHAPVPGNVQPLD